MIIKRLIGWDCFDYAILLKIKIPSHSKPSTSPSKKQNYVIFHF